MRYYCIADEDTVRGFRLAGIAGQVVTNPAEAATALQLALSLPEIGIVILTERVAAPLRNRIETIRQERESPLMVEIPGPDGPMGDHKSLLQRVQEAVGIHISFQEAPQ